MPEERVPRWHPLEALPMIGAAIDGMLDSAQEVVRSLEQARPRPHVLDDDTVGRVREAHGTQLQDLWWYTAQLTRWRQASPTPAQAQELSRLDSQLDALRGTLTASLALTEELQAGTIEKVLAKDDPDERKRDTEDQVSLSGMHLRRDTSILQRFHVSKATPFSGEYSRRF